MYYFISDLHLDPTQPELDQMFDNFIEWSLTTKPQRIYILGDLFGSWLGDSSLQETWVLQLKSKISKLQQAGIELYFVRGNRDIIITQTSCQFLNLTLLDDYYLIELDYQGQLKKVLLTHGDLLCDDPNYLKWRKLLTNSLIKFTLNRIPISWIKAIANYLRNKSQANYQKRLQDKSLNSNQVKVTTSRDKIIALQESYQFDILINGHVHQQAITNYQTAPELVHYEMGDWYPNHYSILIYDHAEFRFINSLDE